MGLTLEDLDALDIGFVMDLVTENANDSAEYRRLATQEDMDRL